MQHEVSNTVLPATRLDALTLHHTAFRSFRDLLEAPGGYCPSLRTESAILADHHRELIKLADAYDAAQAERRDRRRAIRS